MNGKIALKQLKQEYEAMFGIQGPRLELLLVSEIREAIKSGVANGRAPARGSAKARPQIKGYYSNTLGCMVSIPED